MLWQAEADVVIHTYQPEHLHQGCQAGHPVAQ